MTEQPEPVSTPILTTKLYAPPTRPPSTIVPRSRLIERLNEGLEYAPGLTLISAPAGFGKTTLVSSWIYELRFTNDDLASSSANRDITENPQSKIQNRVAWFSLDDGDNDLTRFLTYFIAALQQLDSKIGQTAQGLLQSSPPPVETLMTTLVNDISSSFADAWRVLVLDDYHLIEAKPIHDALTFLLEHLPPHLHLIIATRDDPHLPLARLRVQGRLTELRAVDLRFATTEAADFLNRVMGLTLSAEDVAALENRTEGWIAGLQLAALSMQKHKDASDFIRSFTGSNRFILDYLTEEILEQQPANIQQFLLHTSVLNRLTGSLCDALTGQSNGQAILKMLERANLFIVPLDEQRRWYRYHHLFADLLRQRLHQTQPEQEPNLHRRASQWYEQNGFADEAIRHALRAEDFEMAAALIESQFGDNYERVSETILRRWLAKIPEDFLFSNPQLSIFHAWTLFTTGQMDDAEQSLQAAETLLTPTATQAQLSAPPQNQISDATRIKLLGRIATIRAFSASYSGYPPEETIGYARQALEYLPEQELSWRSTALIALGDAYTSQGQMEAARQARSEALVIGRASGDSYLLMIVNLRLAEILRQQGQLRQVADICERQQKMAEESGLAESAIVGWLLGIWAEVLAELNHLNIAVDYANKGVKIASGGKDVLYEVMSRLFLVRVLFSNGDITAAEEVLQTLEEKSRTYHVPHWAIPQLLAWQARIWLAQGKLETAAQWVEARALEIAEALAYLHEPEQVAFARIFVAQERLDEATRLLQRLLETAETGGRTARVIEILALQALVWQAQAETGRAVKVLEQALILAEPGGFIRTFVDEGQSMARLLREAINRGIMPGYTGKILAAFPNADALSPAQSAPASQSELVEPLSERELEVLQLIAEGLTNREIAAKLFLTVNTVKVHAHNIYGKLNAHSRTQAVAKAQSLGILPDN